MPKLHTVDLEEAELLDPPHEGFGQSLDDEQNPGWACGRHVRHRIEPAKRIGVLEGPGVRVHAAEKEALVRGEVESDKNE